MLINENHLSMMDPEAKKFLTEQRDKFWIMKTMNVLRAGHQKPKARPTLRIENEM